MLSGRLVDKLLNSRFIESMRVKNTTSPRQTITDIEAHSTTERGQPHLDSTKVVEWINQFETLDRPTAALLFESLILVPATEYEASMYSLIKRHLKINRHAVALFAARELNELPYFSLTDPKARPNAVNNGAGVGSEGPTAHLIRDIAKRLGPRVLDHPSIHIMRTCKCREILLIEDIAGTGGHVQKFITALCSHPTIKSWLSLKYLKLTVLVFAKTKQARERILANKHVEGVISERDLEPGRAIWSTEQEEQVVRLCRKYAQRTSRCRIPLGLGNAFTCIVFQHKCPNTAPAILWAGSKTWIPLFKQRPSFDFPVWPIQVTEKEQRKRSLGAMGQPRLAETNMERYITTQGIQRILLLSAVAKRIKRLSTLSDLLNVGTARVKELLADCVGYGWLTWEYDLTNSGRMELDHARHVGMLPVETHSWSATFYFPKTLRGARRSFSASH